MNQITSPKKQRSITYFNYDSETPNHSRVLEHILPRKNGTEEGFKALQAGIDKWEEERKTLSC